MRAGLNILQSALLGVIQGATEFLPISSSGHLLIARYLFNWKEIPFLFDVFLHCATLVVVVYALRDSILNMFRRPKLSLRLYGVPILITTSITALLGVLVDRVVPIGNITVAACGYGFTATLLIAATVRLRRQRHTTAPSRATAMCITWKQAILIGLCQGVAVIPGVSRAGVTILVARMCNVEKEHAFEYSFLISVPAIIGAMCLQLFTNQGAFLATSRLSLSVGALAAIVSGALCFRLLRYLNMRDRISIFIPYLLFLSVVCFIL